jgi:hypothetical protein
MHRPGCVAPTSKRNCSAEQADFTNPTGYALNADRLTVDGSVFLSKSQCTGEGLAVVLHGASVVVDVMMRPASMQGGLSLTRARVGAWHDEKKTWPRRIALEGFVYDSIHAPDATIKDRLRSWLPRNSYLPQPYEQLAGVYRREGHELAARTAAIGKQQARRVDHPHRWTRWPSQAGSAVLRWTIGYGYRPVLALIPLAMRGSPQARQAVPTDRTAEPAMAALQVCRQYLGSWNQAAHDTGGDAPAGVRDEVNAARTACTLLEAERAHVSQAIVREPVSSLPRSTRCWPTSDRHREDPYRDIPERTVSPNASS